MAPPRTLALLLPLLLAASVAGSQETGFMVNNIRQALDGLSVYELPTAVVKDRAALLALKAVVANPPAGMTDTWAEGTNPCLPKWDFIECESGRVSTLQLGNMGLDISQLPTELGNLNALVLLNLAGRQPASAASAASAARNGVAGTLPATWGTTATFQSLKYLHLADNLIESTLPAEWGARGVFPSLTALDLSQNNLFGELPASWSQRRSFPNLLTLDLHANNLGSKTATDVGSYTLPSGADWVAPTTFATLVKLDLSGNAFIGELPAAWSAAGVFRSLRVLDLSDNELSGELPADWGKSGAFRALEHLLLHNNDLTMDETDHVLAKAWADLTSFPSLKSLVVFPGNKGVCHPDPLAPQAGHYDVMDTFFTRFNGVVVPCDKV